VYRLPLTVNIVLHRPHYLRYIVCVIFYNVRNTNTSAACEHSHISIQCRRKCAIRCVFYRRITNSLSDIYISVAFLSTPVSGATVAKYILWINLFNYITAHCELNYRC